ncbi:pyridoxamine 5'-phosphate oxidase family protein [Lachnospiraceae bacterium MD1]|uniref:Pyridoxamine 5'-phosphate oxidase family protein n=1 Tax=Variimorphobacter saccharofermentans TaxID=2755051 RepID=A0A839K0X9_9FIRM|nr:pyridoxamine 5'-phosphate oxidase family protein [Variimorphobacter saccharofermentans]MBB2183276.1 pyridoxamine 5'-phosphate oxidase family protein [Variimorphobacter saccharofermentans]
MRRKDREITDMIEIINILKNCNTLRIAMNGENYPYMVPVSFGLEVINDTLTLYFHCAKEGTKLDHIHGNANVCFESDIFLGYEKTARGITTRYRSVIGFGRCILVEDSNEILYGMCSITSHCGFSDYPVDNCPELQHTNIYKIEVDSITGKNNLPAGLKERND